MYSADHVQRHGEMMDDYAAELRREFPAAELDPDDVCQCEHTRDEHNESFYECCALTMGRRAKCGCPQFLKA